MASAEIPNPYAADSNPNPALSSLPPLPPRERRLSPSPSPARSLSRSHSSSDGAARAAPTPTLTPPSLRRLRSLRASTAYPPSPACSSYSSRSPSSRRNSRYSGSHSLPAFSSVSRVASSSSTTTMWALASAPSRRAFLMGSGFERLLDQLAQIEVGGFGVVRPWENPPTSKAAVEPMPTTIIAACHMKSNSSAPSIEESCSQAVVMSSFFWRSRIARTCS